MRRVIASDPGLRSHERAPANTHAKPDFECRGCGWGVIGKRPDRCIRCGGQVFDGRRAAAMSVAEILNVGVRRCLSDDAALTADAEKAGPVYKPLVRIAEKRRELADEMERFLMGVRK
jgi:hypothetical protein